MKNLLKTLVLAASLGVITPASAGVWEDFGPERIIDAAIKSNTICISRGQNWRLMCEVFVKSYDTLYAHGYCLGKRGQKMWDHRWHKCTKNSLKSGGN